MNLIRAETKGKYLLKQLEVFCDKIEMVGNIRRRKQSIDKIDILLAPKGAMLFDLMAKLTEMGFGGSLKVGDKQTLSLKDEVDTINADLWFTSLERWPVMLLIRTGSSKSVKGIEKLLEQRHWQLSVSKGAILDGDGKKLPIQKEEDIYTLLGIPFIEPTWRE